MPTASLQQYVLKGVSQRFRPVVFPCVSTALLSAPSLLQLALDSGLCVLVLLHLSFVAALST